jgi:hypothetical protein
VKEADSMLSNNSKTLENSGVNVLLRTDHAITCMYGQIDIESSPAVRSRLLTLLEAPRLRTVNVEPFAPAAVCILLVLTSEKSSSSILPEVHVRKSLNVRPIAEHAARPASMNTMFFNALQMASCLHMQMTSAHSERGHDA